MRSPASATNCWAFALAAAPLRCEPTSLADLAGDDVSLPDAEAFGEGEHGGGKPRSSWGICWLLDRELLLGVRKDRQRCVSTAVEPFAGAMVVQSVRHVLSVSPPC